MSSAAVEIGRDEDLLDRLDFGVGPLGHQHGDAGAPQDLVGDAADEVLFLPGNAFPADDDEVGAFLLGRLDDDLGGRALGDDDLGRADALGLAHAVELDLGRDLAGLDLPGELRLHFGPGLVEDRREIGDDVEGGQLGLEGLGEEIGVGQGFLRLVGEVRGPEDVLDGLRHEVLSFLRISAVFGSPVAFCPQFTQDGAKREEESLSKKRLTNQLTVLYY